MTKAKAVTGRWLILLIGTTAPLGCSSGDAINIGNSQKGSQLSDYVGSWDGYAEAYTFMPDGSDRVRLTISANGQGTVEVGNQPLVPPPTDGNVGYPPGNENTGDGYFTPPALFEGFLYPVYNPQVQTSRIQFGLKPLDFYAAWCALQSPMAYHNVLVQNGFDGGPLEPPGVTVETLVPVDGGASAADGGMYLYLACPLGGEMLSNSSGTVCYVGGEDGTAQFVADCGKYNLCISNVCACTAATCTSTPVVATGSEPSQYPAELDAALDTTGRTLTGTLALPSVQGQPPLRLTVVLTKQ